MLPPPLVDMPEAERFAKINIEAHLSRALPARSKDMEEDDCGA
jgi:hypothetical protein